MAARTASIQGSFRGSTFPTETLTGGVVHGAVPQGFLGKVRVAGRTASPAAAVSRHLVGRYCDVGSMDIGYEGRGGIMMDYGIVK